MRDKRHVTNVDEMFAECIEHERFATADGSIKSVMTVFPQKVHAVPLFEKSTKKNTPGLLLFQCARKSVYCLCGMTEMNPVVGHGDFFTFLLTALIFQDLCKRASGVYPPQTPGGVTDAR